MDSDFKNRDNKKKFVWIFAVITMIIIMIAWMFFLKKSFFRINQQTKSAKSELEQISGQTDRVLKDIEKGFKKYEKIKESWGGEEKEESADKFSGEEQESSEFEERFLEQIQSQK